MISEIKYFLRLQIVQKKYGIFISQANYLKDFLKRFGLENNKSIRNPMVTGCKLYSKDESPCAK